MARREQGFHRPFGALESLVPKPEPRSKLTAKAQPQAAPPPAPEPPASDADLFRAAVSDVKRIERAGGRIEIAAPVLPPQRRTDDAEVLAELSELVDGGGAFSLEDSDEYISGVAPGADRGLLRKLRKGDFAVQGHLDLHGLTQLEARDELLKFIEQSRRAGKRCVLVVHGRGNHSKDRIPVLKQAMASWLGGDTHQSPTATSGRRHSPSVAAGAIASAVLAYATARPCDGGAGAIYLLLRKWEAR